MKVRKIFPKAAYVLLLVMALSVTANAGNTGYVSGLVTDQNGGAVNGALVVVKGANMFAMSNADGYFVINGVPVGFYDVNASRVGYNEMTVSNVRVMADLRTNVSFTIQAESSGEVRITAEDPEIDMNITYTGRDIGSESFDTQVADDFQDMLVRTPGIVTEDGAEGTLNLHIRGGRGEEVAYIVDGINITNPIAGGAGMQVPTDSIEAMNVITAGWDAEYGEAQSGIINITTKEGTDKFTGNVKYTHEVFTAKKELDTYKYLESTGRADPDEPLVTWTTSTRSAKFQKINASFGGPIIGKYASFYVGGDWSKDWTVQPIPDADIRWNASGKIALKPSSKYRITLSGARYRSDLDWFDNQFQYILEDHGLDFYNASMRTGATWSHYISESAFYTLTFGTFKEHRKLDINGKHWTEYELNLAQTDPTGWFYTQGDYQYYQDRYQLYYNLKGDYTLDIAKVS
ncbi:MAG: TonB-dependent receptor, partial [bacterium]|nr:TonB-dependent receptor [bacterium]